MHPQLLCQEVLYRSHQDVLCKGEILRCKRLTGPLHGMYPILDQCHVALLGQDGQDARDPEMRRWVYDVTMPVMLVGGACAERCEVHLKADLYTPYPEEKMRYGCQLQCDCDVYPRCAAELEPGVYRLVFDAHISLYSMQLRAG